MRRVLAVACIVIFPVCPAEAARPFQGMIELVLDGEKVEGMPLAFDRRQLHLLGRDGWLWELPTARVRDLRKTSNRFRGCTPSELRATLLRELGRNYEVTGTSHYLVAHLRGQHDQWAQRFEDLYRAFVHYFSVRGFRVQPPPFPLIGVVLPDQAEFRRHSARQGSPVPAGMLGYYDQISNRIVQYDMGPQAGEPWDETARVIIHEATHQTAFNTGVHSRYARPPLWLIEGLATMFEAPGVYHSRSYPARSDRVNRGQLRSFRELVRPRHRPELLENLVASDRPFRSRPSAAYAEAWALSFFLVETRPQQYVKYLRMTAAREPFVDDTPQQRTADFASVFGDDWRMLEARLLRFVATLD